MDPSKLRKELCGVYSADEIQAIDDAFGFVTGLSEQERVSDMSHLFNIAVILAAEKADSLTMVIGLLHHIFEDGASTFENLENRFGKQTAYAVEALTMAPYLSPPDTMVRLSQLKGREDECSYRLRVIGVKIACRLDRMRRIEEVTKGKQVSIARETRDVYVDLAVLMGMYGIADELDKRAKDIIDRENSQ